MHDPYGCSLDERRRGPAWKPVSFPDPNIFTKQGKACEPVHHHRKSSCARQAHNQALFTLRHAGLLLAGLVSVCVIEGLKSTLSGMLRGFRRGPEKETCRSANDPESDVGQLAPAADLHR